MGKRGNSEGTIRKRPDGRWEGRLILENGTRKSLYGKTRAEVVRQLDQAKRDREQGVTASSGHQTVGQYLTSWLADVKQHQVGRSSHYRYSRNVRLHLVPGLGTHPLAKLTAQMVQSFYARKLEQGYASATVQHMHMTLHDALDDAMQMGLVHRNVAAVVQAPRILRAERMVLSEDQARALLVAVEGERLEALIVLTLATGMRRGELVALRWADVDLEATTLWVRRTLTCTDQGYEWSDGKTRHSRRMIALPATVVEALRRHRVQQLQERLHLGDAWAENDLVFADEIGGRLPLYRLHSAGWFGKMLRRAGLPSIYFHDLRHTAATLLLARGVNPKVVSEMLGHSSVAITLGLYGHVTPHMQRQAATTMDAVLRGDGGHAGV